jgi:hypothetical protein
MICGTNTTYLHCSVMPFYYDLSCIPTHLRTMSSLYHCTAFAPAATRDPMSCYVCAQLSLISVLSLCTYSSQILQREKFNFSTRDSSFLHSLSKSICFSFVCMNTTFPCHGEESTHSLNAKADVRLSQSS